MKIYNTDGTYVECTIKYEVIRHLSDKFGNIIVKITHNDEYAINPHDCEFIYKGEKYCLPCTHSTRLIPNRYYFAKDIVFVKVISEGQEPYYAFKEASEDIEPISWL